jgi:hypothetical protein
MTPFARQAAVCALLLGMTLLGGPAARAQFRLFGSSRSNCCPPPCPPLEPALPPAERKPGEPVPPTTEPSLAPERFAAVGGETVALATPNMQGDQLGIPALSFLSQFRLPNGGQLVLVPSIRSFKISENESPRPQDRVYFDFNYFNDVNKAVNNRLGADFLSLHVFRETFGVEKTCLDGKASIGLRLPLNSLDVDITVSGLPRTDTDIGDLSIILKYAFYSDPQTGDLVSAGLAITAPTGPDTFAGSPLVSTLHSTVLQPYLGYIFSLDELFFHGFSAIDVPTESQDVTLLHNDIGAGYFLYRTRQTDRLITSIVPTFEAHINTPLNHRGGFNFADPAATPDWVDLTTGATVGLLGHASLAVGIVTPITGPKPFAFEVLTQLNVRF